MEKDVRKIANQVISVAIVTVVCLFQFTRTAYVDTIPNGRYPAENYDNTTWLGIVETLGAEPNCFDLDLIESNYTWTEVCKLDSDGDGMENGYELGDIYCEWKNASEVWKFRAVYHPGVCDSDKKICREYRKNPRLACEEPITSDEQIKFVIIGVAGGLIILVLTIIACVICYRKS